MLTNSKNTHFICKPELKLCKKFPPKTKLSTDVSTACIQPK